MSRPSGRCFFSGINAAALPAPLHQLTHLTSPIQITAPATSQVTIFVFRQRKYILDDDYHGRSTQVALVYLHRKSMAKIS
jgi:hypothetical protein